jgi:hypothetical protein
MHTVVNQLYYFTIGHFGYAVLFIFCIAVGELYQALNSIMPEKFTSLLEIEEV